MFRVKRGRSTFLLAGLVALAFAVGACGSDDDNGATTGGGASTGTSTASDKPIKVAYLFQLNTTYNVASIKAAKAAVEEAGGTLREFDPGGDAQKQLTQCQDAIATGDYTGILVYPVDGGAIVPCAREAAEAGIKIVALESPIGPDFTSFEPQVDGVAGSVFMPTTYEGQAQVDAIAEACGDKPCKMGWVLGFRASSYDATKLEAVKEQLKKYPNIELVAEGESGFLADGGLKATADMIQANPDLDVILYDDDDSASGGYKALERAGKTSVKIFSTGAGEVGTKAVEAGEFEATLTYAPKSAAKKAVEILVAAIRGDATEHVGVPEYELIPEDQRMITKDNVSSWTAEWGLDG